MHDSGQMATDKGISLLNILLLRACGYLCVERGVPEAVWYTALDTLMDCPCNLILLLRLIAPEADNELLLQEPSSPRGTNRKAKWGGWEAMPSLHATQDNAPPRRNNDHHLSSHCFLCGQSAGLNGVRMSERARTFRAVLGKTGKLAPFFSDLRWKRLAS